MAIWSRGGRIGVVELSGTLGASVRPGVYVPLLRMVERSRRFAGLVLDIDSPGGSVSASEELHAAVARVAKVKPTVAYFRGTGASGAYYVACAAHRIVAIPSALVGSIGVIYVRPMLMDLLNKVGVSLGVYKSGPYKDMGAFWRPSTPEEDQRFQGLVDELFSGFLEVVAKGRRMDPARVRELATGELFTGRRSKELGLVDELGDLESVLEGLTTELRVPRRRVTYLRPHRPFLRRLFGGMAEDAVVAAFQELDTRLAARAMYSQEPW